MEKNDFAAIWLAETGNPAIEELTQLNLDAVDKTTKTLTDTDISLNDLALALDINPDEISRWLTGRHTFSVKVLHEILDTIEKYSA